VCAGVWIHRIIPDTRLPGKAAPFRMFFGRDLHIQLEALHLEIDSDAFCGGLHNYVADQHQYFKEVWNARKVLLQRHDDK